MKAVHELLYCSPAKIYDLLVEKITGERVVRIDFLVKLLQERGQLPLNYYDNDSVSLEDKVRKHYGQEAVEAIEQNLNGK